MYDLVEPTAHCNIDEVCKLADVVVCINYRLPLEASLHVEEYFLVATYNPLWWRKEIVDGTLDTIKNQQHRDLALGHELGHTFFYDRRHVPPVHVGIDRFENWPLGHPRVEHFCDAFAAALLLPESVVQSNQTIEQLAEHYCAPPDIVQWRQNGLTYDDWHHPKGHGEFYYAKAHLQKPNFVNV